MKDKLVTPLICVMIIACFAIGAAITQAKPHPVAHAATTSSAVLQDAIHLAQRTCGHYGGCVWVGTTTYPQAYSINPYAQAGQTQWTTYERFCDYTNPRARVLFMESANWGPNGNSGYATPLSYHVWEDGGC